MNCNNIRKDLVAYLDNELAPSRRAEIARHLDACPTCRQSVSELDRTWKILEAYPGATLPANFTQQVMARAKEPALGGLSGLKRFIPYFAAAAVILLALTTILLLTHQNATSNNGLLLSDELALMEENEVLEILNDSYMYNNGNMNLVDVELGEADDDWEETLLFLE